MKAVVKKEDVKNEGANDTKDEEKKKEFQDAEVQTDADLDKKVTVSIDGDVKPATDLDAKSFEGLGEHLQ